MMSDLESRPKMLLHVCCGPCAAPVLRVLQDRFALTAYYYNPNIHPEDEYERRASGMLDIAAQERIPLILAPYRTEEWNELVRGHEGDQEGGARCEICFRARLERTAKLAADHRFDWCATTLSISPHKNADCINAIGRDVAAKHGINWYEADFKQDGGFEESVRLSREAGLYRQDYCGCVYSLNERDQRRASRSGPTP
jgi:hypothetical protein